MTDEKIMMFTNRLTKVARHLGKQAKRQAVSCYRVYDHDLPEFPLCIDLYADKLYIAEYKRRHNMSDEEHDTWLENTMLATAEILEVPRENIFLKLRQRKPGRLGQYQKTAEVQHEFVVEENGLKFIVNLSDYLDTGLFLDHRNTRQLVREQSKDKRVLNLFAYTGSFSVYAAAGGAKAVTTVDLSRTYLSWAERNIQLNGFNDPSTYDFIHADVKQFLQQGKQGSYDIIIMDPPTFSNSKRMDDILDIQVDHVTLINHCMRMLTPGGLLYFSTNFRKFVMDIEKIKAATIKDITKKTAPFDFEGRFSRFCFLLTNH
jgi:23S rRNA (cytosine1962-C5)-methyltransferase